MDFQDKTLVCRDCGKEFIWTAGEQKFFAEKGFANAPTRCPDDRKKYKDMKRQGQNKHTITCKNCGRQGEVPFTPRDPNDVLCSDCFYESKGKSAPALASNEAGQAAGEPSVDEE